MLPENNNREHFFLKAAIVMMVLEIFVKLLGFIKQSVIAYYYGGSGNMDIYFLSSDFINELSNAIIGSARIAVIAVFTNVRHKKGKEYGDSLLNQMIELTFAASVMICATLLVLSSPIGSILAPNYQTDEHATLVEYLQAFSGIIVFTLLCMIYDSLLNSYEKYYVTKYRSLIYSTIVILACITLSAQLGNKALVLAQYVTIIIYFFVQIFNSKNLYSFRFERITKKDEIKQILTKMGPVFIGNSMLYFNYQIDNSIASTLENGAVSALSYSHTIDSLFVGVLITSLAAIVFPHMANLIAKEKEEEGIQVLKNSLITMIVLLIPVSIIVFFLSSDMVEVIYHRGKFDNRVALLTASVLSGYALRFPFVSVRDLCVQGIYAYGDTKTPMRNSVIATFINIIMSIALSRILGIIGISLGTTVSVIICSALNMHSLKMQTNINIIKENCPSLIKCSISGFVSIVIVFLTKGLVNAEAPLEKIIIVSIVAFASYISVNMFLKERYTNLVLRRLAGKFSKNQ